MFAIVFGLLEPHLAPFELGVGFRGYYNLVDTTAKWANNMANIGCMVQRRHGILEEVM